MLRALLKKSAMGAMFVAGVFLCGPVFFPAHAASGPEEAIRMVQQGIDTKDLALVEKHLDSDSLVAHGLRQMLMDQELVAAAAKNPAIAMALALGGTPSANEVLRTLLQAEARSYLGYGVASGAFAGKPEKNAVPYQGIFGKAFRGGEKDTKVFGPVTVARSTPTDASVTTTLADGPQGGKKSRVYPLTLQVARQADVWRIVEVLNAAELLRTAKERGER